MPTPETLRIAKSPKDLDKVLTRSETVVLAPGESPSIDINMRARGRN